MKLSDLRISKSKLLIYTYIITAAIAFMSKIGKTTVNPIIPYGLSLVWILIAVVKFRNNNFKFSEEDLSIKSFFLVFLIPKLVIHLYSIFLFIIGNTDYVTRNTQSYLVILAVFSIVYVFREKSIQYTIIAGIISYSLVIIYDVIIYGIITIPHTIIFLLTENLQYDAAARLYEVHDYTFAIGYIFLYYIFIKKNLTKKDFIYCGVIVTFIFLGFKRIQILALILIIIFEFMLKLINSKFRKIDKFKIYKFISYSFIGVAYLFIYILSDSKFFDLLNKFNINAMGRNYYYKAVIDFAYFSPTFLGFGRNFVSNLLENELAYLRVGGVHSDILKYYVECGFVIFGLWMWYNLVKILNWINNRYSFRVVSCYFILTLYSFLLYYTDNIDTYFVPQFMYMLIVSVIAMNDNKKENEASVEEL